MQHIYPNSLVICPVLVFLTKVASPNGTIFHPLFAVENDLSFLVKGLIFRCLLMGMIVSSLDEGSTKDMSFPSFLVGSTTGIIFGLLVGPTKGTRFPTLLQRSLRKRSSSFCRSESLVSVKRIHEGTNPALSTGGPH